MTIAIISWLLSVPLLLCGIVINEIKVLLKKRELEKEVKNSKKSHTI